MLLLEIYRAEAITELGVVPGNIFHSCEISLHAGP